MGGKMSKLNPAVVSDIQKHTKFNREEIQAWYKGFLQDCPSGRMTKEELRAQYTATFPDGDPGPLSEYIFNAYDTDHNGTVDFKEFILGLSATSRGDVDEKLHFTFEMCDLNDDKLISKEEMINFVEAVYRMVGKIRTHGDTPKQVVDNMFQKMDKNADGFLSFEEFRDGTKQDPGLLKALTHFSKA
eukprot:m.343474 g.343474  ORF g.343474 m.343474 type:complete len:187 (-) comp22882_c0_seq1:166-726(-)